MASTNSLPSYNINSIDAEILDEEHDREIKILVMGEINSGKSSLIKMFFGQKKPAEVLGTPSEVTIGAEIKVFEYGNAKVGVFDLAGQEFQRWLSEDNEDMYFEADGIILVYELSNRLQKRNIERVKKRLTHLLKERAPNAQCTIILNKYDEYISLKKGSLNKANKIKMMVENITGFPTYIASLIPSYFPLLRLKLERIIKTMPVEMPSVSLYKNQQELESSPLGHSVISSHVVHGMHLQDAQELFENEFDQQISRSEILRSEFRIQ